MYTASYPIILEFSVSLFSPQLSNAFGSYFPCVAASDENSNINHFVDYFSKGPKPNLFWNHVSANYAARELPLKNFLLDIVRCLSLCLLSDITSSVQAPGS